MPSFTYTARNSNGELKSATIDAPSRDEVVAQLRRQRLTIIKVDESKTTPKKNLGSIKMRDIVIFTRQFSTMINAGLPLVQALDILAKQSENKALAAVVREVGGATLPLDHLTVADALAAAGVVPSKSAARRAIAEGGAYVNNQKVDDPDALLVAADLLPGGHVIVRRGKRTVGAVTVERAPASSDAPRTAGDTPE